MSKVSLFLAQNIPPEEFCAFYYSHNITDTAKHLNKNVEYALLIDRSRL